jgi:hypothetical protein
MAREVVESSNDESLKLRSESIKLINNDYFHNQQDNKNQGNIMNYNSNPQNNQNNCCFRIV